MKTWENPQPPVMGTIAGICRCPPGQHGKPGVGSTPYYPPPDPVKPAPGTDYDIERVEVVGDHLVMRVLYKCSYEGPKVMVFLNTTTLDALRWKKIDPHFRTVVGRAHTVAPPPSARFPATDIGWADAIAYAQSKVPRPNPRTLEDVRRDRGAL